MAGIGFELRKIYGKDTLTSKVYGTLYATMTTLGPTIIFLSLLLFFHFAMKRSGAPLLEQMFFFSSFTYEFLVALLISATFDTVISRYVSDKVFESKDEDICASLFGLITVTSAIAGLILTIFCVGMYHYDHKPLYFLFIYYSLGILSTIAYNMLTYVSALKEFKEVTLSYLSGAAATIISYYAISYFFHMGIVITLYISLVIGFFIIDMLLIYQCVKAFGRPSDTYFEFILYLKKYFQLVISGGAYMLGFFISNIIYWNFSDMITKVGIFKTTPSYDLAMFLAILVNLPAMVIFVVKTETAFYDKYVQYLSALNKGTYTLIEKGRMSIHNTLMIQLFFIYEVQLIITFTLVCLAGVLFPLLGLGSFVLNMFVILAMGVFSTLCMHFTVIFLYYFEDYTAASATHFLFLIVEAIAALICCQLGEAYYPLPILIGSIVAWIYSFLCLRERLKKLNGFLLCR